MEQRKSRATKWHAKPPPCPAADAAPPAPPAKPLAPPDCMPDPAAPPAEAAAEPPPEGPKDTIVKPPVGPIESFVIALDPQAIRAFRISYRNPALEAKIAALKKAGKGEPPKEAEGLGDL